MKRCSLAFPLKNSLAEFRQSPAAATFNESLTIAVKTIAGERAPSLQWRSDKLSRMPASFCPAVFSHCLSARRSILCLFVPRRPLGLSLALTSLSISNSSRSNFIFATLSPHSPTLPVPPRPVRISNSSEISSPISVCALIKIAVKVKY